MSSVGLGFALCDFRYGVRDVTFIVAGRTDTVQELVHVVPHKHVQWLILCVFDERDKMERMEYGGALEAAMEQLPKDLTINFKRVHEQNDPHVEYIIGFDAEPVFDDVVF